ncbi:glutamate-cysteine ligase family protein [Streptomyces sp. NPDC056944]|uniref:glutamate-cysteine ligase family protein n=1 Tax=Streptomyces sp. NPDC056944 TaxID=3345972 RepID=UPI00362F55B7
MPGVVRTAASIREEPLLVGATTGEPLGVSSAVLAAMAARGGEDADGVFERELHEAQVEFATRPHTDMPETRAEIVRRRAEEARHANQAGVRLAALALAAACTASVRWEWGQAGARSARAPSPRGTHV